MLILSNVYRGHLRSFCRSGRQCLFEWMIHQLRSSHTPQAALCISTQTATTYGMGEEGKVYEPSRGMTMRDALQRLRHPIMSRPSGGSPTSTRATPAWADPPHPRSTPSTRAAAGRYVYRHGLVPHDHINPVEGEGGGDRGPTSGPGGRPRGGGRGAVGEWGYPWKEAPFVLQVMGP